MCPSLPLDVLIPLADAAARGPTAFIAPTPIPFDAARERVPGERIGVNRR